MISFVDNISSDDILRRTRTYFSKKEYWSFVCYITDKFDKCTSQVKSEILRMLGTIYTEWEAFEQAIIALKYSVKFDEKNAEAFLQLAKVYHFMGDIISFKDAFAKFHNLNSAGVAEFGELLDYFNSYNPVFGKKPYALVDDDFKIHELYEKSVGYLGDGDYDRAILCLEKLVEKFPEQFPAYDSLLFAYSAIMDDEKIIQLAEKYYSSFPENLNAIAMYLFSKSDDLDYDATPLLEKVFNSKLENVNMLRQFCEVLDSRGMYTECLDLINKYVNENSNCKYNYDVLMMQVIANLKIGDKTTAKKILKKVEIAYGDFGLSRIYKYMIDCNAEFMKIANYYCIPDEVWYIADSKLAYLLDKKNNGQECNDEELWEVFELLVMTSDGDTVMDFITAFLGDMAQKNPSKVLSIIYLRNISNIMKADILYALLNIGMTKFDFLTSGGVNHEKFTAITLLDEFPDCYNDAYKYAFAYCALFTDCFGIGVYDSTMELINAMEDSKRKFRDEFALAAAIICNSYALPVENMVENVSRMVGCNKKRVRNYINIIRRNGDFFEGEDDDMFEMLLRKVASKISDIDIYPEE